jgi:hypothetical protein
MDIQGVAGPRPSSTNRPSSTTIYKSSSDFLLGDYIWPSELCSDLKSKKPKKRRRRRTPFWKNRKQKTPFWKKKDDVDLRLSKIPNDNNAILITNQNIYDWGFLLNVQQPSWVHLQSGWVFVPIAVLNNGASYAMVATPNCETILYPIIMKCLNV